MEERNKTFNDISLSELVTIYNWIYKYLENGMEANERESVYGRLKTIRRAIMDKIDHTESNEPQPF